MNLRFRFLRAIVAPKTGGRGPALERTEQVDRTYLIWLIAAAALLVGAPAAGVLLTPAEWGMFVSFILLLVADPVFFVLAGGMAGSNPKKYFTLILAAAGLFVLGAWIAFEMFQPDFLIYAAAYLIIGFVSLWVSWLISRRALKRRGRA